MQVKGITSGEGLGLWCTISKKGTHKKEGRLRPEIILGRID